MKKQELVEILQSRLSLLPQAEIDKTISFYDEMIQDRMEDGMSEEEAVTAIGSIDSIVESCMLDASIPNLVKKRITKSKERAKNKGLWTALVIMGSPVWFPLLLAAGIVLLAMYIVAWSLIISFYAVVFSFAVSGFAGILGGVVIGIVKSVAVGFCLVGCALICVALTVFLYQPVKSITQGMLRGTKSFLWSIKARIMNEGGKSNE